ncbi:MAG: TonB-dependent receptor [Bacteroidia bacterium]|nr:TonB-dependent receptor [Bacteroidia bacterium]
MKNLLFPLFLFLILPELSAQKTLSGYVRDAQSGEILVGAIVAVPQLKTGTYTNNYGFYSLTLKADSAIIRVDYPGYNSQFLTLILDQNQSIHFSLTEKEISLDEVVITEQKARENVEKATMGAIDINVSEIEMLPFIAGEKDLLKGIQLLPGVQSGGEASAGYYVRGGGADQNLILMDEAIVYNPFHMAGYLSIFNTDAIRNVTLYKGSYPANFGGRLSSILDIGMKEGNMKEFHGEGGIGLISSKITLEGPIAKDRASFMVSARRFYWDLLIRPFLPPGQKLGYNFHDFNAKINYKISDKDRLFISGYYGRDNLYTESKTPSDTSLTRMDWGNITFTARWNHLFGPKLFSNTSFIYSNYDYKVIQAYGRDATVLFSGIKDVNGKIDFDYYPNPRHRIKFGLNYIYHTFTPSSTRIQTAQTDTLQVQGRSRFVHESAAYINDEIAITDRFGINAGLRAPLYVSGQTTYYGLEPRLTLKYTLGPNQSIKAGYTLMNQYVHLVSSSVISLPFDIWTPSSEVVKPQVAHQGALGYFRNFLNDRYETSVELYYKRMSNQIDYREGANFFFRDDIEPELVFGKGWAYGGEFYIRKRSGRLTGWIGYTLSWSWRQFDDLNLGRPYPAKYDRRHDLSVVAVYKFNEKWSFSSTFVYGSGHWLTVPSGRLFVPVNGWTNSFSWYDDFSGRNGYRLQSYHRLDLGLRYVVKKPKYTYAWHIDIYNSYNRRNPFFVYQDFVFDSRANARQFVTRQVSLLPMIPSLTWVFNF